MRGQFFAQAQTIFVLFSNNTTNGRIAGIVHNRPSSSHLYRVRTVPFFDKKILKNCVKKCFQKILSKQFFSKKFCQKKNFVKKMLPKKVLRKKVCQQKKYFYIFCGPSPILVQAQLLSKQLLVQQQHNQCFCCLLETLPPELSNSYSNYF